MVKEKLIIINYFNMTPTDPVPFGQYKGTAIKDVPASYLDWLEKQIRPKAPNKRNLSEKYVLEYIDSKKQSK